MVNVESAFHNCVVSTFANSRLTSIESRRTCLRERHNCWCSPQLALLPLRGWSARITRLTGRTKSLKDAERIAAVGYVGLTLRVKLCGRGPRTEADAARRLSRRTPEEANCDLQLP